ncbi:MAG: hypothetical protein Q8T11_15755 [Elusimicrobiota bacterium]|nr:hypothetical protein [Elusimicrobiota bacterium]
MRPLPALFACLLAVPAPAQVVGEAASAAKGSSAAGAAVSAVPGGLAVPALSPSLAPGLQGTSLAAPAAAPAPGAPVPVLAPSLISPVDPKLLPAAGAGYTSAEWSRLVSGAKDEGTKAVLNSALGDNPADPRLSVTLANGERVDGAFRGLAGGKMIFQTGDKLVGLDMAAGGIAEVRRTVDVLFDGASLRPDEVVVHSRAPVADPFRDLARHHGRFVDIDTRDLDDLKWSAQTVSGRIVKADGNEILLEGPKGEVHLSREYHRVDKVALRTEHYASRGKISSISDVRDKLPDGAPVEVVLHGGKTVTGRFFGLRKDAEGDFILLEVPAAGGTRFRAYRDFYDLRTAGFGKGDLLPGSEVIYTAPDK